MELLAPALPQDLPGQDRPLGWLEASAGRGEGGTEWGKASRYRSDPYAPPKWN